MKQKKLLSESNNSLKNTDYLAHLSRPMTSVELAEMRQVEGFPLGDETSIQEMSLPPYYTACPNPFLKQIVDHWKSKTVKKDQDKLYHREPFAADIKEGKHDPIYKIHSYHTKVPPRAILRYILHYTDPGDIVLDAFCGSGMTGVAAQLCGSADVSLRAEIEAEWSKKSTKKPRWGARYAILGDLSPVATTIAANYNLPVDPDFFEETASNILEQSKNATFSLYNENNNLAPLNYAVWSQVFICPNCSSRINFMEQAYDLKTKIVSDTFVCPSCNSNLDKRLVEKSFVSQYDPIRGDVHNYTEYELLLVARGDRRHSKLTKATPYDKKLAEQAESISLPATAPIVRMPIEKMYHGSRLAPKGVEYIHDLFFRRQLYSFSDIWERIKLIKDKRIRSALRFLCDQTIFASTKLSRFPQLSPLGGVFYLPSMVSENVPVSLVENKIDKLVNYFESGVMLAGQVAISTNSASQIPGLEKDSVDYIFTDPPFGENIFYADLNFIIEAWYGVFTSVDSEAIVDKPKNKDLLDYETLMYQAFREYYRVLKSGHWITVVFHNSSNAVWNAIQQSMVQAGFVVADVRMLDKQQKSFRQVTSSAVKQDLVISAYKPVNKTDQSFEDIKEETVWEFIREHLIYLPVFISHNDEMEIIRERQAHLLFDRMVATHVQRGLRIPLDFSEFLRGLLARFPERDGMFFLPEQIASYDDSRAKFHKIEQLALFVTDEKSALQWLRNDLDPRLGTGHQSYAGLQPKFLKVLHQTQFEKLPELRSMLKDNFLQDEKGFWYVPNPELQADLDAMREKALLREFNALSHEKGKIRQFRAEAIRAGFSHAWRERDYGVIVKVAERLPENILQEDQQLLMYYHNASLRQSGQPKQEALF